MRTYRLASHVIFNLLQEIKDDLEPSTRSHAIPGPHSSSHRCPTFCYGFRVERHVSWKRCATGFEIHFLLFGGCVRNVSPISSNMCINHAVLKRQLAQWIQVKSFITVSAAARNNLRY